MLTHLHEVPCQCRPQTQHHNLLSPLRSKGRYARLCRGSFLLCAFSFLYRLPPLIVSQHNPSRRGKIAHAAPLQDRTMSGRSEPSGDTKTKNHTDGEKTMTISLCSRPDKRPNTSGDQRILAGPVRLLKTKFSKTRTDIYQTVTDSIICGAGSRVKPWSLPVAACIRHVWFAIQLRHCTANWRNEHHVAVVQRIKTGVFSDSRWMT